MDAFLAKKLNLPQTVVKAALDDWYRSHLKFTTANAKDLWEQNGKPVVSPSTDSGRVTIDDVRRALGVKSGSKEPSPWNSPKAKELAEENGLSEDDFPQSARTGHELKSGYKKISLDDVKAKAGLGTGKFSSTGVAQLALSHGLSPKDFIGVDKIRKSDVEALIKSRGLA